MNKQGHIISVTLLQIMIVPLDVSALTEFAVAEEKNQMFYQSPRFPVSMPRPIILCELYCTIQNLLLAMQ